ncbi:MAG: LysR substrate-binding domain-containing protein [Pseudomonadota bacterium]
MRVAGRRMPLGTLQGFEAAARHLNMRRAAEELGLTQSAVSHQVRGLEAALGARLFERTGRRLLLTREGARLLVSVQQALDRLAAAAAEIGGDALSGPLRIAAPPSFATQWLMPRLPEFLARYPELSVSIATTGPGPLGPLPKSDLAIVFNADRFPGMRVETLVELEMFPVCAPALSGALAEGRLPLPPEALSGQTLIHEDDGAIWARWFAATGTEQRPPRREIRVASAHDALELARLGAGFAVNDAFMGGRLLGDGGLVRPFEGHMAFGRYALVMPGEPSGAAATAFQAWLKRQITA